MSKDQSDEFTRADVVARLAARSPALVISVDTWSAYVGKGQAPPGRKIGRTPLWTPAEVDQWAADRPGSGRKRPVSWPARAPRTDWPPKKKNADAPGPTD
jgi:predicted DNA-binding transcriptional regulator AlpA